MENTLKQADRYLYAANQLIFLTGGKGIGKTTAAGTFARPSMLEGVYWHDEEDSANNFLARVGARGYKPGYYLNLRDRFQDLPAENDLLDRIDKGELPWVDDRTKNGLLSYYTFILQDLKENLIPGKFHTYIHDPITMLEAGMAAWVENNQRKSGVTNTAHGRLWTDGVFPLYSYFMSAIFARGVKTIIFTSHLKNPWQDNKPVPGKVLPSGKKILYTLARAVFWLVKDSANADKAPAALVLKERMLDIGIDEEADTWETKGVIPERIPHFTWDDVRRYLIEGCDLQNPAPGEVMSEDERMMVSDMLTDKQLELMILSAKADLAQKRDQSSIFGNVVEPPAIEQPITDDGLGEVVGTVLKAKEASGLSAPAELRVYLMEQLNVSYSIPQIIKALKAESNGK